MVTVVPVDPHDDAAFRAWYDALHSGATAGRTAPVVTTYDALAASLRDPGSTYRRTPAAAVEGNRTVGAALLELPLREDLTAADVEVAVPPEHRRRGIGTALWEWAAALADSEGRTVLQAEVNVPVGETEQTWPGSRFAHRFGFRTANVEDHLVVPLPLDVAALERLRDSVECADAYSIRCWVGAVPDDLVEAYADLHTGMARDVPTGELTREAAVWDVARVRESEERLARSYVALAAMAFDGDAPVGYTLIYIPRAEPEHVLQDDTYVLEAHRGHNLGVLLKVANAGQLRAHVSAPGWLHTWTATSNAAMQRVNARFGFRATETLHEVERSA
jgi:GNAT superfamily N-acetyltransferase